MNSPETVYPDISDVVRAKAERRRDIARRSFGDKIVMMELLRERVAPFKRAREKRHAAKLAEQNASGMHGTSGDSTSTSAEEPAATLLRADEVIK